MKVRRLVDRVIFLDNRGLCWPGLAGPWAGYKEISTLAETLIQGLKLKSQAKTLFEAWADGEVGENLGLSLYKLGRSAGVLGPLEGLRFNPVVGKILRNIREGI